MSLSVLMKFYKNKYEALQAAKWLKNFKTVEELSGDITQFENKLNADVLLNQNKCPHCKIEMQSFFTHHFRASKVWTCRY